MESFELCYAESFHKISESVLCASSRPVTWSRSSSVACVVSFGLSPVTGHRPCAWYGFFRSRRLSFRSARVAFVPSARLVGSARTMSLPCFVALPPSGDTRPSPWSPAPHIITYPLPPAVSLPRRPRAGDPVLHPPCILGNTLRTQISHPGRVRIWSHLASTHPATSSQSNHVRILHIGEREDYVVVYKPHGMLVHRNESLSKGERTFVLSETRKLLAAHHGLSRDIRVVHRLDRATSGVMVFSLGESSSAAALQEALRLEAGAQKEYWALARAGGSYEMPAQWENRNPLKDISKSKSCAPKDARTEFERLAQFHVSGPVVIAGTEDEQNEVDEPHTICVVRAKLHTGRRHQIRRHLSNDRFPIIGDTSYGKGRYNRQMRALYGASRLSLHARRIQFREPGPNGGRHVIFEVPVAQDLQELLSRVQGFDAAKHAAQCDL